MSEQHMSAEEHAAEAAEILRNLIDNIEAKGNYSAETTILFLNQALSEVRHAASRQAAQGEAVATIVRPDPEADIHDEGPYMGREDWLRLQALPPGTKLYTHPAPSQPSGRVADGLAAELHEIAGRVLEIAHTKTKPVSHTLLAPMRDYTLADAQKAAHFNGERLASIADRLLATPTPDQPQSPDAGALVEALATMADRLADAVEELNSCMRDNIDDDMEDPDTERGLCDETDELVAEARGLVEAYRAQGKGAEG